MPCIKKCTVNAAGWSGSKRSTWNRKRWKPYSSRVQKKLPKRKDAPAPPDINDAEFEKIQQRLMENKTKRTGGGTGVKGRGAKGRKAK